MSQPPRFVTLPEIRRAARGRLPREVWNFGDGGAETETTLRRNRRHLDRLAIQQHVLIDVRQIDLRTSLLGVPLAWPVSIAPMGAIDTGHARGTPRRLVRRSIWRTSMRTCCWIARRSRWRRLRRSVVSVSAPPSPKFHTSRGRRPRAARRISGSVTKRGGWLMPPYYTLPREGTDADVSGPGTSGGVFRRRPARPPDSPDC